jgi:phosphate uptake regulator
MYEKGTTRKVIKLSTSTSVISLPTSWLKKNNIKKGDNLTVDEKDNLLIISKQVTNVNKNISFSIKEINADLVWTIIDSIYMEGYAEINIETKNQEQKNKFIKIVQCFPGLIIYEEKGDIIKLKNISIQEDFDLQQIISRIRNLTISLIDDSLTAMKTETWDVVLNAKERDYIINTYVSMAFRHINKYGYSPTCAQGAISQYIKLLEMFADELCLVLKKIGEQKEKNKQLQEVLGLVRELYREDVIIFSKFSLTNLSYFDEKRQSLLKKTQTLEKIFRADFFNLSSIFFDIEEILTQLNIANIDTSK